MLSIIAVIFAFLVALLFGVGAWARGALRHLEAGESDPETIFGRRFWTVFCLLPSSIRARMIPVEVVELSNWKRYERRLKSLVMLQLDIYGCRDLSRPGKFVQWLKQPLLAERTYSEEQRMLFLVKCKDVLTSSSNEIWAYMVQHCEQTNGTMESFARSLVSNGAPPRITMSPQAAQKLVYRMSSRVWKAVDRNQYLDANILLCAFWNLAGAICSSLGSERENVEDLFDYLYLVYKDMVKARAWVRIRWMKIGVPAVLVPSVFRTKAVWQSFGLTREAAKSLASSDVCDLMAQEA